MYDADFTDHIALSNEIQDGAMAFLDYSIDLHQIGDEYWIEGDTQTALEFYIAEANAEGNSELLEQASWEAYYGPVNAEGYTAYDASHGYTTQDTSLIEPATSAGSMSMISSYDTSSTL